MAGHSKWANIQHRKGRQDEKRQRVWTRVMREIMVATRMGGGDIATHTRLRLAVEKGKAANMPGENSIPCFGEDAAMGATTRGRSDGLY